MRKLYPTYEVASSLVQKLGIKTQEEYHKICKEFDLPTNPSVYYRDKGWVDWYAFLGKKTVEYPPYVEAKRIVQEKGIKSHREYKLLFKDLGLPSSPENHYKEKGWVDWYAFFGKKTVEYPSYAEAKQIVLKKGIKSYNAYVSLYKELGLPSAPNSYYKDTGWIDWPSFFSKEEVSYPPYEEAQRMIQKKGILNRNDYRLLYKELGLPSDPSYTYKDKGWISWSDFFGKTKFPQNASKERLLKIVTKLSLSPDLLKDDANIKLVYMLASQLDKKLANKIEGLLEKSSYEERLDWVKEQLEEIKEETTPVYKITPVDELSEMESIIDEFGDLMEALPEEAQSDLNTIIENYIHSIVNKDLIAENDG